MGGVRIGAKAAEAVIGQRTVLSSEMVLNGAIKAGEEKLVGFTIDGVKTMVGKTMQRDILRIATDAGAGKGSVRSLLGAMEKDALSSGANSIRIVGHEIQNATFFRNAAIAERLGYTFKTIDKATFELTKVLVK